MNYTIGCVLMLALCFSADAGLVITKKKIVRFGKVYEKDGRVVVEFSVGEMKGKSAYKKNDLIWYTPHPKVTSHYMGARYAYSKKDFKISKFLAERAIQNEPKYKKKAEELLIFINKLDKINRAEDGDEDDGDDDGDVY